MRTSNNIYQEANKRINQLLNIKSTKRNTMKTTIRIKYGKLGYLLFIGDKKVNFSDSEFCTIEALRKYWNHYRVLLLSGFRHDNLKDYLKANIQAGN